MNATPLAAAPQIVSPAVLFYIWESRINAGMTIAALALTTYDTLLTFDQSTELVYTQKWSRITAVFLLNQYFTLLLQMVKVLEYADWGIGLSIETCYALFSTWSWGAVFSGALVEGIMILRVNALYGGNRSILIWLLMLYVACLITACVINGLSNHTSAIFLPSPVPSLVSCYNPAVIQNWFFVFYIPTILFETTIFLLTFVKVLPVLRKGSPSEIYSTLIRDGFLYFSVTFVFMLLNIIFLLASPIVATYFARPTLSVMSIMGTRLLLNLREAARRSHSYSSHAES